MELALPALCAVAKTGAQAIVENIPIRKNERATVVHLQSCRIYIRRLITNDLFQLK